MTTLALILVALPFGIALYAYAVYPAILWAIARTDGRVHSESRMDRVVTIVVPAYNEEAQIRGAVEALIAQDYPADRRQILVISDASTDGTDRIVSEYQSRGVELLRMPTRSGKTAAENASIPRIRGEIIVNTDASIRLHPSTVRHLVRAMADPTVGVASSRDVSVAPGLSSAISSEAEAGYVGYEMRIRALETAAGGIVGASGSGYAIRFDLHRHPVRADLSRDFSAALTAYRHGLRAVSVEEAICFVPRTSSLTQEYRRKVRTISRGMDTLSYNGDLLNPIGNGLFAWKLASHKLCRWLVPVTAPFALVGLALLSRSHAWSRWMLSGAAVLGVLAILGARWPDARRVPRFLPRAILGALAANLAVVHAVWRFVMGHEDHLWEPTRRSHSPDAV